MKLIIIVLFRSHTIIKDEIFSDTENDCEIDLDNLPAYDESSVYAQL